MELYKKTFDDDLEFNNLNFQKIINFYLFECPVENVSYRGNKFKDYGIIGSCKFSKLKKEMLNASSEGLRKNYYPCQKDELEIKFELIKTLGPCDEYCVFMKYTENTVMQSLYSAIRNAIAHGSFSRRTYKVNKKKVNMYFFINYDKYKKAEIILKEESLLKWIDIIKQKKECKK